MPHNRRAAVLIDEPAEVEFRNGMFYITDGMGVRAMQPIILLRNFETTAKAIQTYHGLAREDAAVIPFPDRAHKH